MSLILDHLGEEIAQDVTQHDAALHRILTKLRAFDDGGGYVSQGFRTCAQWLSWRVNWTLNTAREHVRVANALSGLPLIDRALECGQLSYCKVRAITRVANAANEASFLEMACHMTGHDLEKLCRKYASVKRHDDPNGTGRPASATDDEYRRYVHRRDREDGMVTIEAVLHPEEADVVMAAIERIAKERCQPPSNTGDEAVPADTSVVAVADAATAPPAPIGAAKTATPVAVADAAVAASANTLSKNVSAEGSRASVNGARQPRPSFDRATALVEMAEQVLRGTSPQRAPVDIMITIPVDTLFGAPPTDILRSTNASKEHTNAGAGSTAAACCSDATRVAFVNGGSLLSNATVRRLACDAGLIALIEDSDGNALSVGRKRRTIPAAMKYAMLRRDQHKCRFPGCNARAFLQGHHLEEWMNGGLTELNNLLSLCGYHHRFVHEYGFRLELDPESNSVTVHAPAKPLRMQSVAPPARSDDLSWSNIVRGNEHSITADTQPTWDATPVDWGAIVDVILRSEDRANEDDETN